MNSFTKYVLLAAMFCLAILCYFIGSKIGAIAFIVMGVLLELAFWLGIFRASKRHST